MPIRAMDEDHRTPTFPAAGRWLIRACLSVILVLALILVLIVLPVPTMLIQDNLASLLQPMPLIAAGIALLVTVIGGAWFVYADRRYGRRCPYCSRAVSGRFKLGQKCPACGQVLHPWLLANY